MYTYSLMHIHVDSINLNFQTYAYNLSMDEAHYLIIADFVNWIAFEIMSMMSNLDDVILHVHSLCSSKNISHFILNLSPVLNLICITGLEW